MVVSARVRAGLRARMGWALFRGKEPASDVYISTLVIHGRLENAGPDVDGTVEVGLCQKPAVGGQAETVFTTKAQSHEALEFLVSCLCAFVVRIRFAKLHSLRSGADTP